MTEEPYYLFLYVNNNAELWKHMQKGEKSGVCLDSWDIGMFNYDYVQIYRLLG